MNELLCCPACGLMMQDDATAYQIKCPRCRASARKQAYPLEYSLGIAIAALIMFVPALFLPIMIFKIGGMEQVNTMLSALEAFYEGGYPELSLLVFIITIAAPISQIVLSILIFYPLSRNEKPRYMKTYYKILYTVRYWMMLDVYIIAILVATVKLTATSELLFGPGLVMFIFLTIFCFLLSNSFSPIQIWKAYHNAH